MRRIVAASIIVTLLILSLASCDSFSLLSQFRKTTTSDLALTVEKSSVLQGEAIALYPSGGTPPYSFGLVAGDLAYSGTLGTVANQIYTAGTAIGTVQIHLTDADHESADSTVTIIPPAPTGLTAAWLSSGSNASGVKLQWSYSEPSEISGFVLLKSMNGQTPSSISISGGTTSTYTDASINQNMPYTYQLYAVARSTSNEYQSLAAVADLPAFK